MALSHQIGEERCTIFAQDISQRSNKMLKLNLILNGLVSSLDHAVQGDTLVSPYHKSDDGQELRQFDYVVSNPPFKMDFSDTRERIAAMQVRFWGGVPKVPAKDKTKMAIYTLFVQHVVNSLKKNGKGAIVVPTGFLTAKSGVPKSVLQKLVDDRIVYGAISMPSNVFCKHGHERVRPLLRQLAHERRCRLDRRVEARRGVQGEQSSEAPLACGRDR